MMEEEKAKIYSKAIIVFIVVSLIGIVVNILSFPYPKTDIAYHITSRTTDLLHLQLSKEQVESGSLEGHTGGSILGNVGYVQGSSEGKPVTYIYIRYRADNGDIIDRLIPRDQVRFRDDLASGEAAKVELEIVKKREASYEDIQQDPSLCYDINIFRGNDPYAPKEKHHSLPAEKCGKNPGDTPGEWQFERETPAVVHVPKNSVIVTINPNMVPDGAKK